MSNFIHGTATVERGARLGDGCRIWHHAVIRQGARVGGGCTIGQNVYIAPGAVIGSGVKLQNNVSVFDGVTLEDLVFCGPGACFTNVTLPRCEYPKPPECYEKTLIKHGASLGAGCVILCGVTVGRYAMIAAGAVVTSNVPDHALMAGVPARLRGWVCRCGGGISASQRVCRCGLRYIFTPDGPRVESEGAT